jgi:hypothetical protein
MKLETLRELIKQIPGPSEEAKYVKEQALKYIDLYEQDNKQHGKYPPPYPILRSSGFGSRNEDC